MHLIVSFPGLPCLSALWVSIDNNTWKQKSLKKHTIKENKIKKMRKGWNHSTHE